MLDVLSNKPINSNSTRKRLLNLQYLPEGKFGEFILSATLIKKNINLLSEIHGIHFHLDAFITNKSTIMLTNIEIKLIVALFDL